MLSGIRVPCIVRWPGVVPAGSSRDETVITMDWRRTFLDAAGLPETDGDAMDGVSLMCLLRDLAQTRLAGPSSGPWNTATGTPCGKGHGNTCASRVWSPCSA